MTRSLSPWNPLDYLRLLVWIFLAPDRLLAYYRQRAGWEAVKRVGKWLASTLIWLPPLIPTLALNLGTLPVSESVWHRWLGVGLVLGWILTGLLGACGARDDGDADAMEAFLSAKPPPSFSPFLQNAVGVAGAMALFLTLGVAAGVVLGMADFGAGRVVFGMVLGVAGIVAAGVALGVAIGVAGAGAWSAAFGVALGAAFGVWFGVAFVMEALSDLASFLVIVGVFVVVSVLAGVMALLVKGGVRIVVAWVLLGVLAFGGPFSVGLVACLVAIGAAYLVAVTLEANLTGLPTQPSWVLLAALMVSYAALVWLCFLGGWQFFV